MCVWGRCLLCTTYAYVHVHKCLWCCWYHSLGWHQSLTDTRQMFSSVPVDTNKSKQLEEETSEKKIRAKQPSGYYPCHETRPAGKKSLLLRVPLLQGYAHSRRFPSQSFPYWRWQNKERLKDVAVVSFCKFSPPKKSLVVGEEERRGGGRPWGCTDNKFAVISLYPCIPLIPTPTRLLSSTVVPKVMETSSPMFGFVALAS